MVAANTLRVTPPLTPRQQKMFRFIGEQIATRLRPPTLREIGDHMGISSPNGVVCHLKALERKGLIRWKRVTRRQKAAGKKARACLIEVVGLAAALGPAVRGYVEERIRIANGGTADEA